MAVQSDGLKKMDKQGQTDFGQYSDISARCVKIEIVLKKKKKKKKTKPANEKMPGIDGVIKEEEAEESYYEYYEEEVDEDDGKADPT
jgi:hypothetical protein